MPVDSTAPAASAAPRWRRGFVAARDGLRDWAGAAVDLVFPPVCIACRRAVDTHGGLCAACWSRMRFIERPFCERLGVPFAQELGAEGLLSPEAIAHPPVYSRARAVCVYEDGPARGLVHRLKYHDRLEAARPMGAWMARDGAELLAEADCLIPVPLHRTRLFARRFNQAAALAHAVSRESGVPVEALALARRKRTSPQVGLSKSQRALNLQGAFVVREEMGARIAGRRVVLIDDVITSGATANAAARALRRAGAAEVDALAFARVVAFGL
jgi:ComF family protein